MAADTVSHRGAPVRRLWYTDSSLWCLNGIGNESVSMFLLNVSHKKVKGSPYSITERRVPELIPVLGSQPAGDVSHKPGGRLPLLWLYFRSARPAVTLATLKRAATNFGAWCEQLPKTVTRQRRSCDLNPGPSAPESSTLTTRLLSHPDTIKFFLKVQSTFLSHNGFLSAVWFASVYSVYFISKIY